MAMSNKTARSCSQPAIKANWRSDTALCTAICAAGWQSSAMSQRRSCMIFHELRTPARTTPFRRAFSPSRLRPNCARIRRTSDSSARVRRPRSRSCGFMSRIICLRVKYPSNWRCHLTLSGMSSTRSTVTNISETSCSRPEGHKQSIWNWPPFPDCPKVLAMKWAALLNCGLLLSQTIPGPLTDGGFLLPNGWTVRPAGRQIPLGTLPMSAVLSPDKKFLLVLNAGYDQPSINVLDAKTLAAVGTHLCPTHGSAWPSLQTAGCCMSVEEHPAMSSNSASRPKASWSRNVSCRRNRNPDRQTSSVMSR